MHASIHAKLKIFKNGGEKTTYSCTSDTKNKDAVVHRLLKNSCHLPFVSSVVIRRQILYIWWGNSFTHPILTAAKYIRSKFIRFWIYSITPLSQFKIRKLNVSKEECQGVLSRISGNFSEHFSIRSSTGETIFYKTTS